MTEELKREIINKFENGNDVYFTDIDKNYLLGKTFYIQYDASFKPRSLKTNVIGDDVPEETFLYKDFQSAFKGGSQYLAESFFYPDDPVNEPGVGVVIRRATLIQNETGQIEVIPLPGKKILVHNQYGMKVKG